MRTPYYLGVRSLVRFESALRDVDRQVPRALLDDAAAGEIDALDARKQQLAKAELSRRRSADAAAFFAIIIAALGLLVSR